MEKNLLFLATILTPLAVIITGYIIKVEQRLSKIMTDICWIKKKLDAEATHLREKGY